MGFAIIYHEVLCYGGKKMSELYNEKFSIEKIIDYALKIPGVRINREDFLRKELSKFFCKDTVEKAIQTNPAQAGIIVKKINKIANGCIGFETTKVTAISAATGIPGGVALFATIPTDIIQYFSHVFIVLQKLAYLYGWADFTSKDGNELNDETKTYLMLFLAVMVGVNTAGPIVDKAAQIAIAKAQKKIAEKVVIKETQFFTTAASKVTTTVAKKAFADEVSKSIPLIGAVASGGLTLVSFLPMAQRLKKHLETLPLADVNTYKNTDGKPFIP